jgi:hypothetical protein
MTTTTTGTNPTPTRTMYCRGLSDGMIAPTATKPGYLVLTVPGTLYKLHLIPEAGFAASKGARLKGRIVSDTRRVDKVDGGGRFVEPLVGRIRRVQGTVISTDSAANTITVECGGGTVPGFEQALVLTAKLGDARQKAADFAPGQLVCFDCPGESRWAGM